MRAYMVIKQSALKKIYDPCQFIFPYHYGAKTKTILNKKGRSVKNRYKI